MEESVRSGGSSEVVVKNRSSSGCLIVRRKGDVLVGGHVSSESRKVYMSKKEKSRRMLMSDSGSSEEILGAPRRRVGPETIRVCNDLTAFGKGDVEVNEIGRKREWLDGIQRNGDGLFGNNGLDESERKRSKLDVFDFNEYDSMDVGRMQNSYYDESGVAFGGRRFPGAMQMGRSVVDRDFEAGSSRLVVDKRSYFERMCSMNRGSHTGKSRLENNGEGSVLRDKFAGNSDQAIRLQGKNGVLKVLVNKKMGIGGTLEKYKFHKTEEHLKAPRADDTVKKTVRTFYPEEKILEKPRPAFRPDKKHLNSQKSLPAKSSKSSDWDSEDSDTSLKPEPENVVRSSKRASVEHEDPPARDKNTPNKIKEAKLKRGSGTEKQKLRERIRGMLVDAGWTIDYRPRRNRDYLDAVYINPAGTAYWSIIKAYDALQKQVNEEDYEPKPSAEGSSLGFIADEDLCQLTRKTRKKIEKEMKNKQQYGSDCENAKETRVRRSASKKRDSESMDSGSHDEKLSSFIKQGGKSFKSRINEDGFASASSNGRNFQDTDERQACGSNSHMLHGRKSKKLGRCTLLVRSSNKGQNSESDGFVPYPGKRTVLSWMIDSGAVQLSQKVQYKNRRRTRVMLQGWITRDGIHCGCCSKILTVSKFELHAASTVRQPYQNIYLDSGDSLLECQIDAWNRQEGSEHVGFHSVDIDGDDPNDDTCGICGDGGDLICCDGCPSTFHLGCLDVEMLPLGDWHCPHCTCKFCGIAAETPAEENNITTTLLSCGLCEKKYHESCVQDLDASSIDSSSTDPSFCGQTCKELYEHLQRLFGIKHDLEAGFSWSLVRRTDEDSKSTHRTVPQRVECNSKLAVAMTVMDECFLPIVDRRNGINLIRNVLYNRGSNFNRLNYTGFYTAILERSDEIICAASLRFHGTKLAEMPFIGTRHIYRRQGMCRKLFSIIESVLCSLKVEKLVIPAISELTHAWTEVFGFTPLEEALKHEMRFMNMLVFPGIDMLQKILAEQEHEANVAIQKDTKKSESEDEQCSNPEVSAKPDIDSPTKSDPIGCDDINLNRDNVKTEEVTAVESGSQRVENDSGVSNDFVGANVKGCYDTNLNHTIETTKEDIKLESGSKGVDVSNTKPDVSSEPQSLDPIEESAHPDSPSGAEISGTTSDRQNASPSKTSPSNVVAENKPLPDLVLEDTVVPSVSSNITPEPGNPEPVNNGKVCTAWDSPSGARISETTSDSKNPPTHSKTSHDHDVVMENDPLPYTVPDAVTSVSSNVSPEIENPEPIIEGKAADTMETVPGSEDKLVQDLLGENKTESTSQ